MLKGLSRIQWNYYLILGYNVNILNYSEQYMNITTYIGL